MSGADGNEDAGWLIIGLGNADRGDDGAGVEVARSLAATGCPVAVHGGDGLGLIELWHVRKRVIVVDAVVGSIAPGDFARFDATSRPLPAALGAGRAHGVGLAEAIEIARALSRLPRSLVVYAVGALAFTLGSGVSSTVSAACAEVTACIRREIAAI